MKTKLFFFFAFLAAFYQSQSQPYAGTIFVDSDIITASDSSTFVSATYTGQGIRTVFDRREADWVTINAFLFNVVWNDGLTSEAIVNPEFGTADSAQVEAEKYGWHIGQLPTCLRTDVNEIWIHKGVQLFGGGNFSILIHIGQSELYENDGILEETLVHEASHTSLDAAHAAASGWLDAQMQDGEFISDYAEEFPDREDIAESFLLWMAVRFRADRISAEDFNIISQTIPNRMNYFDNMNCDMFPINVPALNSEETFDLVDKNIAFPNPASQFINLNIDKIENYIARIYDCHGFCILTEFLNSNKKIQLTSIPSGLYFLTLQNKGKLITEKIIIK